jgi:hypothetical protein
LFITAILQIAGNAKDVKEQPLQHHKVTLFRLRIVNSDPQAVPPKTTEQVERIDDHASARQKPVSCDVVCCYQDYD